MSYKTILSETDNNILIITLNRPKRLNALSPTLLGELKSALDAAAQSDKISVVVIKATGRAFCVGYDLNEEDWITSQYPANFPNGVNKAQDKADIDKLLQYWLDMWQFPKPIIVAVNGACLSGAGEMLAVCDLVIASENATFGHPAGRDLGIPPTVFFWPVLIGMRKSSEMLLTARMMSAKEAEQSGLINRCVPAEALEAEVMTLARDVARTPAMHLKILKDSNRKFFENMGVIQSTQHASKLDADFHQSPTFLNFFNTVKTQGMKAAIKERFKLFG